MSRRLLLDAGNSSLKWAMVDAGGWVAQGRCEYENCDLAPMLTADTACFIASVASPDQERMLAASLRAGRAAPQWLKSEARFGDLTNGYVHPEQLGVDRWMGMIAARVRVQGPALVVSAGTALTVDAISEQGDFLGGVIVPGAELMRRALADGTARVFTSPGAWHPFPRCTADAVESGIIAALCGAIATQASRLETVAGSAPKCLLTGGDAPHLLPHLNLAAEYVPTLVLEGIERVTRQGPIA